MKLFPKAHEVNTKIFYILIVINFILSVILTVETILLGFAFHHNIKWLVMMSVSILCYWAYRKPENRTKVHHVFFIMLTFILLPVGWLYSPLDSPFTIAYAFILAAAICFYFNGFHRVLYIIGLIGVCTTMMYVEFLSPDIFPVMSHNQRLTDIGVQMPLTLSVLTIMLTAFSNTLRNKNLQLEKLTKTDELTGLYNRRYIYNHLSTLQQHQKAHVQVGVIDIDNFKAINDHYGHIAGDKAIQFIAETLLNVSKKNGIVGRLGGDEFIIILDIDRADLEAFCHNLSQPILVPINHDESIEVTLSGGFSTLNPDVDIDEVITSADKKLYQSKQSGKSRIFY